MLSLLGDPTAWLCARLIQAQKGAAGNNNLKDRVPYRQFLIVSQGSLIAFIERLITAFTANDKRNGWLYHYNRSSFVEVQNIHFLGWYTNI